MRIRIKKDKKVNDGYGNELAFKKNRYEFVDNTFGRKLIADDVAEEAPFISSGNMIKDGESIPLGDSEEKEEEEDKNFSNSKINKK